ncbi:aminoglycoside 6'-N-acetyltransferase [Cytobacillus oceanisediminis]|uniref:Aminoglycoside 6'-N-acetyltransferase n=1 Tax=Cytobacillus oceanisediminis TaxID=665099 RepID=A0A2V3A5F2_9BACI|nr:GNAT family N-acetyltransferase [Cytobacillus oceanisediminis]PWW28816.1 aminoglycoside 6'-N-acetyltransferase [Cytobacillus oceanisediminis]
MIYQTGPLSVRLLKRSDNLLLQKWLSDPAVLEFYEGRDRPFDLKSVNQKFFDRDDGIKRCLVEYEGARIGYIQFYGLDEETRELYGYSDFTGSVYGTDQFIGETEYWNKGIGTLLVKAMADYLLHEKQAGKLAMDPQTRNERAIRCYEKCGYKKVRLLPKNELHEGEYRDCWVMEYAG